MIAQQKFGLLIKRDGRMDDFCLSPSSSTATVHLRTTGDQFTN
jgi:hypothetical protein